MSVEYYIITRFNLRLWPHDKSGKETRTPEWLDHRFMLFKNYCLPSIIGQTCKDFIWIVLMDAETPIEYKTRMDSFRTLCPQLTPVYVSAPNSCDYARASRQYVLNHATKDRVISTYFDNDDALNKRFVEETFLLLKDAPAQTFLYFDDGIQYWPSLGLANRITDTTNHFLSVVEDYSSQMRTVYGYGGHRSIKKIIGANIINKTFSDPMWCEVVHEHNKVNDAFHVFTAHPVSLKSYISDQFCIPDALKNNSHIRFAFLYVPRYFLNLIRRAVFVLKGRPWWK